MADASRIRPTRDASATERKIPEAAGPRGAKDSGYFREAIANCVIFDVPFLFVPSKADGQYDFSKNGSTRLLWIQEVFRKR